MLFLLSYVDVWKDGLQIVLEASVLRSHRHLQLENHKRPVEFNLLSHCPEKNIFLIRVAGSADAYSYWSWICNI
jgi:hypothetical protein